MQHLFLASATKVYSLPRRNWEGGNIDRTENLRHRSLVEFDVGKSVLSALELELKGKVVIVYPEAQRVVRSVVFSEYTPAAGEMPLLQVCEIRSDCAEFRYRSFETCRRYV